MPASLAAAPARGAVPPPAPPGAFLPPGKVFTPTQPKTGRRRLVGRRRELARIIGLLQQDQSHVVLYSERGRGKTSLANLVVETLRREGVMVARHICEAGSTFDTVIRGLMRDLPSSLLAMGQAAPGQGCEAALPAGELRPRDVLALPDRLACQSLVCVVDEFDRVQDGLARTRLADTIKQLSDRNLPLQFLVVGVSDDLEAILGQHPSIQRSVCGLHLPLVTDGEIAQLITAGGREAGFTFLPASIARVAVLSRGMPYMAQMLGLRLVQAAAARDDRTVSEADFDAAVARMVEDAPLRVVSLYAQLTDHGRDATMVRALRLVATAPQDPWGRLQVEGAGDQVAVGGRSIPKACWDRIVDSGVLQPGTPGSGQYSFSERGLMHHVLLLSTAAAAPALAEDLPPWPPEPVRPFATEPVLRALAGGQPWTRP